jgi:hypothetical protein
MTTITNNIISLLFNILGVCFLWFRNERSDRWISLMFINVIIIQILQIYEKYSSTNITPVVFLLLLLIHPLINLIGGFIYKGNYIYIDQIAIYLVFIIYIFFFKIGYTNLDKNYLSLINHYEWAFYVFSLLFSMYLYTTPQNITMMIGTYLILFISYYLSNYNINTTFPLFYNYLSFLLGGVILY